MTSDSIEWLKDVDLLYDKSITEYTKQDCDHLFLMAKYQDKQLWWHQFVYQRLGPFWFGTDAGSCCFLSPQADLVFFNGTVDDVGDVRMYFFLIFNPANVYVQRYHTVKPGSRNGDHNGLTILLDAEVYNYAYFPKGAEGFKVKAMLACLILRSPGLQCCSRLLCMTTVTNQLWSTLDFRSIREQRRRLHSNLL